MSQASHRHHVTVFKFLSLHISCNHSLLAFCSKLEQHTLAIILFIVLGPGIFLESKMSKLCHKHRYIYLNMSKILKVSCKHSTEGLGKIVVGLLAGSLIYLSSG